MPSGIVALLDDIAVIARLAATSLDDIGIAAGKAGTKAAGIVIDDAAVTPSYVTGFTPDRELPILAKIARGSIFNKMLILLPGALILSEFLPGAIIFVLILGGFFLSYEGAEKVMEKLGAQKHGKTLEDPIIDVAQFEKDRVSGAIRTDLILSAEIMAITLNEVADESLLVRAGALALIGLAITVVVYGAVALIVKMDDVGLHLAKSPAAATRKLGRGMVLGMPFLLVGLSFVGTIAMLWVGGGILLHAMEELGVGSLAHWAHGVLDVVAGASGALGGVTGWLTYAGLSAILGLVVGSITAFVLHKVLKVGATEPA